MVALYSPSVSQEVDAVELVVVPRAAVEEAGLLGQRVEALAGQGRGGKAKVA